jgi:site-specific recombinase XerD
MAEVRYPEDHSTFIRELPERDRRFAEAREDYLMNYRYNTARAYWGDLEHLYDWCESKELDIFALTEQQFRQYQALLRRRKYSESTIRRRRTAWRGFQAAAARPPHV